MCGIIGVVRRPSSRPQPALAECTEALRAAERELGALAASADLAAFDPARLGALAASLAGVDQQLCGSPGTQALIADAAAAAALEAVADALLRTLHDVDVALDAASAGARAEVVEELNAALGRAKDAAWAIARDRLPTARAVADLARDARGAAAVDAYLSVQVALSAIDRLEVRGRDSAGLHVLVHGHGLALDDPAVAAALASRQDALFENGSVRVADGCLSFVYKAAAEIGELGDNTRVLRDAIRADDLLRRAVDADGARAFVLGHTRWASVGIISEANAHPLNHEEVAHADGPYVVGALNGDVDNYADLKALEALDVPTEITTDAKVIPTLVSRRLAEGRPLVDAFRSVVASFEGSVAIAAQAAADPERLLLALRGSGQALYVGLADDELVVASEPYGLVEETSTYLRLDGETPHDPDDPATRGQVVVLDARRAGDLAGIERYAYDGTPLPIDAGELHEAEITTRDVDRGEHPHFFLKEISEAPASFRKTLRGKIVEVEGRLTVRLGDDTLPPALRERLRAGEIRRVIAIAQGTAAIAAQSVAVSLLDALGNAPVRVEALHATELSGFGLVDDMRDTLVIAVSQSGTTTDTNRTVDLVRARGATVLCIVNRRNSDLVDKSDGVLYTSDGRDVEMSVASTKAFYSQVAAGFLLAHALADELGDPDPAARHELLGELRALPAAMLEVLGQRAAIAEAAARHAPPRRHWAVVGNGINRIAANEVRIKLSELCYKSIACDATEDKKHIDLSSEPLILVCAAGLSGSNADDVAKELAIYRAHKAAPIVIASAGEERFLSALDTITVPAVHPRLAFVLAAMAGHLFGYEAALAIDASARPLREARGAIESVASEGSVAGTDLLEPLAPVLEPLSARIFDALRAGTYDGQLEAGTAVRLAALLRYATRVVPLESYQLEFGKVGTPSTVVEDLTAALTAGIEQLTRPVDAIKHQAKTVTVGISRSDDTLLRVRLVQEVLATGVSRDHLSYRALRTLVELDPAVAQVTGFTRYRIEGDVERDQALVHVVDRGGLARDLPSRTEQNPVLRGTKHRVASEREVTVVKGRADGRTLVIVPEVKGNQAIGLALLHVRFAETLPADVARKVLLGYRNRYAALRDAVTETEPTFRDDLLADVDLVELLTAPVFLLAERWRG